VTDGGAGLGSASTQRDSAQLVSEERRVVRWRDCVPGVFEGGGAMPSRLTQRSCARFCPQGVIADFGDDADSQIVGLLRSVTERNRGFSGNIRNLNRYV
jgi:hypothetical protein